MAWPTLLLSSCGWLAGWLAGRLAGKISKQSFGGGVCFGGFASISVHHSKLFGAVVKTALRLETVVVVAVN